MHPGKVARLIIWTGVHHLHHLVASLEPERGYDDITCITQNRFEPVSDRKKYRFFASRLSKYSAILL